MPFPPQLYAPLPTFLKRTLFLDFPIFVFDPATHADQSKMQERRAEEGRSGTEQGRPNSGDRLVKADQKSE